MQNVFADMAVSVAELKDNPVGIMAGGEGMPVALLEHDRVVGYMVPAAMYESMMNRLEMLELVEQVKVRAREEGLELDLDDGEGQGR